MFTLLFIIALSFGFNEAIKGNSCPDGYTYLESSCYLNQCPKLKWEDAMDFCEQHNGSLIVINSMAEGEAINEWLSNMGVHDPFWAGIVGLDDYLNKLRRKKKSRRRLTREAILPFQCVLDKSEGFRCFNPGTAITICEVRPVVNGEGSSTTVDATTASMAITTTTTTTTTTISTTTTTTTTSTTTTTASTTTTTTSLQWADTNILVTNGYKSAGNRVNNTIAFTNEFDSCNYEDFPLKLNAAVAFKDEYGQVVICGGFGEETSNCHAYIDGHWERQGYFLEPNRAGASVVEIQSGKYLIMGGYLNGNFLSSTTFYENGHFVDGPELPEPMQYFSALMLNETHLFIAASRYQLTPALYSPKNYLLDIRNYEWTELAERTLTPSNGHCSGTFYNETADEIQVVNVGRYGIEVYSPNENNWQTANSLLPEGINFIHHSTLIQKDENSFYLIGGATNNGASRDIYHFNNDGLIIVKKDALPFGIWSHVAIAVDNDEFPCNM